MNIGLDMMGGDFAPLEAVKGIKLYLESIDQKRLSVMGYELVTHNPQPQPTTHNPNP